MEINNLLEGSASEFKVLQEDASRLADKWGQSGLLEGLEGNDKGMMARILENQAKQVVAEQSNTGTGASFSAGAGEQWAGVALPLVRKVFAQIAAKDCISSANEPTIRSSILLRLQIWIFYCWIL